MDGQVVRCSVLAPGGCVGVDLIQRIAQSLKLSITECRAHLRDATGPTVASTQGQDGHRPIRFRGGQRSPKFTKSEMLNNP